MKFTKKNIVGVGLITVAVAVLGVLAAARISDVYAREKAEKKEREALVLEYSEKLDKLNADAETLSGEINLLNQRYTAYLDSFAATGDEYYNIVKRYDGLNEKYRLYSGLLAVNGSGIRILLDDGTTVEGNIEDYMVVHDSTLINIVAALRSSGAQAISINGERIVFNTDIVCAGPSITVNGRKIFAPFDIKAIGNSDQLYNSFVSSDAYKKITLSELKYDVSVSQYISIGNYTGNYSQKVSLLTD